MSGVMDAKRLNLPAEFQQSISNVSATEGGKVFAGVHIHGTDRKSRHQSQKLIPNTR